MQASLFLVLFSIFIFKGLKDFAQRLIYLEKSPIFRGLYLSLEFPELDWSKFHRGETIVLSCKYIRIIVSVYTYLRERTHHWS